MNGCDFHAVGCRTHTSNLIAVVSQGSEGNSAIRVGIIHVFAGSDAYWTGYDGAIEGMFLQCFSVEREVRLVRESYVP